MVVFKFSNVLLFLLLCLLMNFGINGDCLILLFVFFVVFVCFFVVLNVVIFVVVVVGFVVVVLGMYIQKLINIYSGNNVIVDKLIVLNSLCNVGDCLCNVWDCVCIRKIGLCFLLCVFVCDCVVFLFCNFFYGMLGFIFKIKISSFCKIM